MKVSELIAELDAQDPEAEVQFVYNYGDHWRTHVAAKIKYIEGGTVRHSDYHQMDAVVFDEDKPENDVKQVVLIW